MTLERLQAKRKTSPAKEAFKTVAHHTVESRGKRFADDIELFQIFALLITLRQINDPGFLSCEVDSMLEMFKVPDGWPAPGDVFVEMVEALKDELLTAEIGRMHRTAASAAGPPADASAAHQVQTSCPSRNRCRSAREAEAQVGAGHT